MLVDVPVVHCFPHCSPLRFSASFSSKIFRIKRMYLSGGDYHPLLTVVGLWRPGGLLGGGLIISRPPGQFSKLIALFPPPWEWGDFFHKIFACDAVYIPEVYTFWRCMRRMRKFCDKLHSWFRSFFWKIFTWKSYKSINTQKNLLSNFYRPFGGIRFVLYR